MASLLKKGGAGLLHEASAHTGAGIDARAPVLQGRGGTSPLSFWRASLNGETIWRIRMESSMYWLDLIAETYIGICVLCCLFIISKQRRRPAPMMRVMLLVWPIITLWAGPWVSGPMKHPIGVCLPMTVTVELGMTCPTCIWKGPCSRCIHIPLTGRAS